MRNEVEELRKNRRSDAELREEAYQDAILQEGEHTLDRELRHSLSIVDKLTARNGRTTGSDKFIQWVSRL